MDISTTALRYVGLALAAAMLCLPAPLVAQTDDATAEIAAALSPRVLFAVSGGFWQEENVSVSDASEQAGDEPVRGYFRAIAIRSEDNTSRLYLQRIRLGEDGPMIVDSTAVEAVTEMGVYITDMHPESSSGVASPGFAAFVYLKDDPATAEPDTYELFVDDFGDVTFAPASN